MPNMKRTIAGVGVIGLMVVAGSAASAPAANTEHGRPASPFSPVAAGQLKVQPPTVLTARHLKSTALSTGSSGVTAGPGFAAIDQVTTLRCPGTKTCTFEADQNVEASGSWDNNRWGICTKVDGTYMPYCPYLGYLTNGGFQAGSFIASMSGLSPGSHSVQTFIYTDDGAQIDIYAILYRVYTP